MTKAQVELLEKRIAGLKDEDFDLQVWQSGTSLLLTRIFGEGNSYSREIDGLKVDFSSWSLRDATSSYNPKETAKRRGREILELAAAELQMQDGQTDAGQVLSDVVREISDELAVATKKRDIQAVQDILKKEKKEFLVQLLVKLLIP